MKSRNGAGPKRLLKVVPDVEFVAAYHSSTSIDEFCERLHARRCFAVARERCNDLDLPYPGHLSPGPLRPDLQELLTGELNMRQIAEKLSLTSQAVEFTLASQGWLDIYKQQRRAHHAETRIIRPAVMQQTFAMLADHLQQRLQTIPGGTHYYQWLFARNRSRITDEKREKHLKLFGAYEQFLSNGHLPTLRELAAASGLIERDVSYAMRYTGLPTQRSAQYRGKTRLSSYGVQVVQNAYACDLPTAGVAQALRITGTGLEYQWSGLPSRNGKTRYAYSGGRQKITWGEAMDIYEAEDSQFSNEEIALCIEKPVKSVQAVLTREEELRPFLVRNLQIMFGTEITTPYIPLELLVKMRN